MTALLEAQVERTEHLERAATLRAGLITAAIYNVHRQKGHRSYQPGDFVREPVKILSPEEMKKVMDSWAGDINRRYAARR